MGLFMYPLIVARQRIGKHVPTAAKIVGVVSFAVLVSKECRRLVLLRTYIFCSVYFIVIQRKTNF
jgi:hypothetical protein